jgi:glycosyltransferase involved in cell wall biosynthesis
MKAARLEEQLIDKDSKPFDVVVISKFQISAPWLGISKAYDQMIQSMNRQGLSVCLVTEGEKFSSMVISPLLTVKRVPASTKRIKSLMTMPIPHPTSFWLSEIVEFLNLGAVVVAPIVGIQTAVFRIPKSGNQKFISTLHTPYSNWTPWGFIFQLIQKKTLSYSDIEVANSKTIVRRLKLENSMTIRIIPHSNQSGKRFATDETQLKKDPIWIGTLTHRKGVNRLALLVFLIRKKTKLRIIWSSSKFDLFWRLVLKKFAKFGWCELEQNLTEDELSAALANASCLISTTRFESFGLTIIEAARAKTGVVGIRAPGVTETLPESTGGAIYFTNVREVSKYLHGKSSENEFENLGNNAASYVETTYDFDKISKLWHQVLCD